MIQLSDGLFDRILAALETHAKQGNGEAEELLDDLQTLKAERNYSDLPLLEKVLLYEAEQNDGDQKQT